MTYGSVIAAAHRQLEQRKYELENRIRELTISSDQFIVWLLGFAPEDVVGQANIPDRDPLVQFVKARTG